MNSESHGPTKGGWSFRIAGILWLGGGLYAFLRFVAVLLRDGHLTPLRLAAPVGCALIAICGYGLCRQERWAKRLASALAPLLILVMLDLLLMIAFKRGFSTAFYLVCAVTVIPAYTIIALLIEKTGGSDNVP